MKYLVDIVIGIISAIFNKQLGTIGETHEISDISGDIDVERLYPRSQAKDKYRLYFDDSELEGKGADKIGTN